MGHEQLKSLLADTVMLLCKNGLQFHSRLKIEGLIGITVDSTVFLVRLNEEMLDQSGSALLCQENNSDDRLNIGSSNNQFKSVEKTTLKPVVTRNIASPKRNDSSSLTGRYHNVRPQKIESKVTSIKCERTDAKNVNIDDADASNDCTVVCETEVKREVIGDTTANSDDCIDDRGDGNSLKNSKDLISQNTQNVTPLVVSATGVSVLNIVDERLDLTREYDNDDNNFKPISNSSVRGQSSSLSSGSHYKHNGTEDYMHNWTSAKRRFGTPNAQHVNFKRANLASSSSQSNGSNAFVLSQSVHICAYPQCGKQFQHKHHLLRHQTRKHGREPMRNRRRYGPYDDFYSPSQQQSYFDADDGEENYYYEDGRVTTSSSRYPVDGPSTSLGIPGETIDEKYSEECGVSSFVVSDSY